MPYGEVKDMDDIFLYLYPDRGDPVSYAKLKAKDYMEPNP